MKTLLLFIVCSTLSLLCEAQLNVSPDAPKITNVSTNINFDKSCIFDYDLHRYLNRIYCNSTVGFNIEKNGTGRLFIYVTEKSVFEIAECREQNDTWFFDLINTNGIHVKAYLLLLGNEAVSFRMYREKDNTAIILFNK